MRNRIERKINKELMQGWTNVGTIYTEKRTKILISDSTWCIVLI